MSKRALFDNPVQAITVTHIMVRNLSHLVGWMLLGMLHLALILVVILALWWFQVTPAAVQRFALDILSSTPISVASALGLSVIGAAGAYATAVRWLWPKLSGRWLGDYLLRNTVEGE